jgi:3-hydroxybutyryl-CoA dehydratase
VELKPVVRTVTHETIDAYEEILGIGNPLHFDEEYASQSVFRGIIAHGMMSLAYISEMMSAAFGKGWYTGGELETTFTLPIRPGDTITARGRVVGERLIEGETCVVCEVCCENQKGEKVLRGMATARSRQADSL